MPAAVGGSELFSPWVSSVFTEPGAKSIWCQKSGRSRKGMEEVTLGLKLSEQDHSNFWLSKRMTLLWLWCDSHMDTWLMTWVSTAERSSGGRVELSLFLCWNFLLDGCGGDNIFAHMHPPWRTWFHQGAKASIARMAHCPWAAAGGPQLAFSGSGSTTCYSSVRHFLWGLG